MSSIGVDGAWWGTLIYDDRRAWVDAINHFFDMEVQSVVDNKTGASLGYFGSFCGTCAGYVRWKQSTRDDSNGSGLNLALDQIRLGRSLALPVARTIQARSA